MKIKAIIHQLTLEEKAFLCVGGSYWRTASIPRLNIPNIMVIDGPSGINKLEIKSDHTCPRVESENSILFPCSSCTCCSFDRDIMYCMGEAIGDELVKEGIQIILGPGVNIKRSPLCGRNFEYFSEDPYLSSKMSGPFIKGVQSKGVGCCIKHFAAYNQESFRFFVSSNVDERTFREIYLSSFEFAIKEAKPWAVMSSYNKINGIHPSIDHNLLTTILRDEWKWNVNDENEEPCSGVVMSDWGGTYDRIDGIKAGLDLEMPGPEKNRNPSAKSIVNAVKGGLDEKLVDQVVGRILNIVLKAQKMIDLSKSDPSIQYGVKMTKIKGFFDHHHQIATKIAENSIVLLKNEDSILPLPTKSPLSKSFNILFLGQFAKFPHVQGAGSARVKPYKVISCLNAARSIVKAADSNDVEISFIECYDSDDGEKVDSFDDAIESAKDYDVVVIFAGTPQLQEIESKDRLDLKLPDDENELIEKVCEVNKNVVIVLQNGSPVEMPWVDKVKAILETYFAGEGCGEATAKILFGLVNPSGHLAETFPVHLEDNPSYGNFATPHNVEYKEGVFVGYRHYESKKIQVLFPFGHGLSYTKFEYKNIRLNDSQKVIKLSDDLEITVLVDVQNIGEVPGKTVAQLYVSDLVQEIERPVIELKGFEKVELKPGEMKTIEFKLNKRSFAWWNTKIHDWFVSAGKFKIIVGQSSRDPNSLTLDITIQTN